MAASVKVGHRIQGKIGSYLVSAQIAKDIWTATGSNSKVGKVIVKTAPQLRLENERDMLKQFHTHPYIRQLLDEVVDPPSLILQHFDDDLLHVSGKKALVGPDVKFVAKRVLQAIQALHEEGYTHTDIKPDNILVNHGTESSRFADVQLADFGNVMRLDPQQYLKVGISGPHMGAAIFQVLRRCWSSDGDNPRIFGHSAQLLIWGLHWHMFKPKPSDATANDEEYLIHILIRQLAFFGPLPRSYSELIPKEDTETWHLLAAAVTYIMENDATRPFYLLEDDCLLEEDREFLLRVMKLDPSDRPTARELLRDKWFDGVP